MLWDRRKESPAIPPSVGKETQKYIFLTIVSFNVVVPNHVPKGVPYYNMEPKLRTPIIFNV